MMNRDEWERMAQHVGFIVDSPKDPNPSIARDVSWDLWREEFGHYEDSYEFARLALAGKALAEAVESALGTDTVADSAVIRALAAWKELAGSR